MNYVEKQKLCLSDGDSNLGCLRWFPSPTLVEYVPIQAVTRPPHMTRPDERKDYGDARFISAGTLSGRLVIIVWTPRGKARQIISIRKATEREIKRLAPYLP